MALNTTAVHTGTGCWTARDPLFQTLKEQGGL